jgi:hypothetical protein
MRHQYERSSVVATGGLGGGGASPSARRRSLTNARRVNRTAAAAASVVAPPKSVRHTHHELIAAMKRVVNRMKPYNLGKIFSFACSFAILVCLSSRRFSVQSL